MPSEKRQRQRQNSQARAAQARAAASRRRNRRRGIVGGAAILGVVAIIALFVSQSTGGTSSSSKTTLAATSTTAVTPTTAASAAVTPTTVPGAPTTTVAVTYGTTPCPNPNGSSSRTTSFPAPPQKCIDDGKTYTAIMNTDAGQMTITLASNTAPLTVNNFVFLARYHFFDGLTFHRVIPGFVDQGGDPKGDGTGGPGYMFRDELPAAGAYQVGSLAMANSGPNTNGSQFFIIVGSQGTGLPPQYSLFGMITAGINVAHAIEADGTSAGTPKVVHKILTVTINES